MLQMQHRSKHPKSPERDRDGATPRSADPTDSQFAAPNPIALNLSRGLPGFQQGRNHNSSIASKFDPDSAQFAATGAENWEASEDTHTLQSNHKQVLSPNEANLSWTPAKRPTLRKQESPRRPYTSQERSGIKPRQRLGLRAAATGREAPGPSHRPCGSRELELAPASRPNPHGTARRRPRSARLLPGVQ